MIRYVEKFEYHVCDGNRRRVIIIPFRAASFIAIDTHAHGSYAYAKYFALVITHTSKWYQSLLTARKCDRKTRQIGAVLVFTR